MFLRNWRFGLMVAAAVLTGSGCGKAVGFKGKVILDGAPVAGATVQFIPKDDAGHIAIGTTDKDGYFRLTTFKQGDGALRGEYVVTVSKMSEHALASEKPASPEAMEKILAQGMKMWQMRGRHTNTKTGIPGDYADRERTPLIQTVPDPKGNYTQELSSMFRREGT